MILKLINSALILVAVFLGIKHGWNMLMAKPEMLDMFGKWNFSKNAVILNGAITLLASSVYVRQARDLPPASFRFPLAKDTLALS
ncbi:hypothetical protein [Sphingobacterium sp. SGL-16]|uniref:hypothetical protein n=1 Tax=Sphingobacterium sp. SGL-16 TaxID=2710883 RepID=UPI0013EAE86F|nr:hypothetical protein [Sphingobacterium sp. SGL-16]NGM71805.1 hypothetical protein [Sphingobacterium sp. SGL-16]